jgi:tol-pal system protein YbgF
MKIWQLVVWILVATVVALTMAPTSTSAANKDTEMILAELRRLQAQVTQLQSAQTELGRLLNQLAANASEDESFIRKTLANTQTTLQDVKDGLSILSSRLDETNGRIGNMRREMSSLRQTTQPLLIPSVNTEPGNGAGRGGSPSGSGEVTAAAPGPVELYNQAYTDYTQMRYPLAISGFKEVIQRYPESDLADNAQYWIGECLMAQRQYKRALESFEDVLRMYPGSNKLAEASYKKAMALEALGRKDEAIEQLEAVIEEFPRTQVERNATQRLKALRNYQPSAGSNR